MEKEPARIWEAFSRIKSAVEDGEFDTGAEFVDVADRLAEELGIPFDVVRYMVDQAEIEIQEEDDLERA